MKTLFVFFVLFFVSLTSSIEGKREALEIKRISDHMIERELWLISEEANDLSMKDEIINRWEISFQLLEDLLEAEESGDMICISLQPQAEDHNNALELRLWFNDMTLGHFNWVNNIGRCETIHHQSHGRMIHEQTHPRMYNVSVESIAQKLFPELNHVNMSCRGSYEWLGDQAGELSKENEERFNKVKPPVKGRLENFIPSEYGIGNLEFTSPQGHWSFIELSEYYNKYL